ncbi:Endoglucanase 3 [Hordeum vulgare]|nr:Endoglucanase 3 [Hordeum vulgare]
MRTSAVVLRAAHPQEAFSQGLHLGPRHPKYIGSTKHKDWLTYYTAAVGIAGGNKRVALHYAPLMLLGSARTWLNNLSADSVNGWLDFREAFVHNFTGTYKRPGRPLQLALCVQGPTEPLRDYLMRWTELRNSRDGVHEVHAIQYFIDRCLYGTLLKHKLMRREPSTLAHLMAVVDQYAMVESSMKLLMLVDAASKPTMSK